jgi:hypothetical protein
MTMSEAFARYCQLYVPEAGALDVLQFAQLKGAFAAGLVLGSTVASLDSEAASVTVAQWTAEIEEFWKEPPP